MMGSFVRRPLLLIIQTWILILLGTHLQLKTRMTTMMMSMDFMLVAAAGAVKAKAKAAEKARVAAGAEKAKAVDVSSLLMRRLDATSVVV